jgi:hypothetical protein
MALVIDFMVTYEFYFDQIHIHNRWHNRLDNIEQINFYHCDSSCSRCNPPTQNTPQFNNFWNWFSAENPAVTYTHCTQEALEDLDNSLTTHDTWESIYSIVFSIRYSTEPRPYTNLHQELYNAHILTDTFRKDPLEELYQISEFAPSNNSDNSSDNFNFPDYFHPLLHDLLAVEPVTPGLLFTDEDLHIENLFVIEPLGLLFTNEDLNLEDLFKEPTPEGLLYTNENLNLEFLFKDPEPAGLLFADEDLNLEFLFNEPEEPDIMAMNAGAGGFNPNALLNI